MKIAFISYWSLNEGLTQATVLPHVKLLRAMTGVEKVILFTIERSGQPVERLEDHIPLYARKFGWVFLNKFSDFLSFTPAVREVVKREGIQLIISRSSLAGGIGFRVARSLGCRHATESFEPHDDYMLESGVWSKWDLRYHLARYFQRNQCAVDNFLMPVSHSYAKVLLERGVRQDQMVVVPCTVDTQVFRRTRNDSLMARLHIQADQTVGVYAGKFGGLYFDQEAFEFFAVARATVKQYFQLILTTDPPEEIRAKMVRAGFAEHEFAIVTARHDEISDYLSLAHFAFATYRPSPSKRYLSPIKVGEYWACGLPVLLTEGVGDDAEIISREGCGAVFTWSQKGMEMALHKILEQLKDPQVAERNQQLARTYRNRDILVKAYELLLSRV
ncbi:MAG TPA: glycosyltransferase [Cyclobacteriaceae bacterium]|nr:glycosyltransferase [Cyclobacteriaceae bacterium]